MKKTLGILAVLVTIAAVAIAVPLTPGIAPITDNTVGPGKLTHTGTADNTGFYRGDGAYTGTIVGDFRATGHIRQGTGWHSHGGFQGVATTITVGSSGVYYPIKNTTDNLWVGVEQVGFSWVADNLVVANTGDYTGIISFAISGTNGHDIFVRCFNVTDNVASGYVLGNTVTGTSNYHAVTLPLYLEVHSINSKFRFEVMNASAGVNVVIRSAVYNVRYMHD